VWDLKDLKRRDGVVINFVAEIFYCPEVYLVENNKWGKKAPLNPMYLSFQECQNLLRQKTGFNSYTLNSKFSNEKVTVIPVTREILGIPKSVINDNQVVLKSNISDVQFENIDFERIQIEPNKWGYGEDGLAVYYRDPKDGQRKVEKYALMDGAECVGWVLREAGIWNGSSYDMEVIEVDESYY
ncbi:MAG: hypothetical protein K2H18_06515, partial [Muribaculaceae bacterium]|nr:hypothetical protein [Muribaculaceae bacterium]